MATYNDYIQQGMSPNQAALQTQLGPQAPLPLPRMGNQPVSPQVAQQAGIAPPAPPPAPAPSPSRYAVEGVNMDKFNNADHMTPKYQIMRAVSQFDPSQGLSDDVMKALNGLGLGTFERTSGDKLRIGGNADPRFEGLSEIDLIRNLTGAGDKAWQFGIDSPSSQGVPSGMAGRSGMVPPGQGAGLNALLSGDPFSRIQGAIQTINGNGQVNLDALLGQLGSLGQMLGTDQGAKS